MLIWYCDRSNKRGWLPKHIRKIIKWSLLGREDHVTRRRLSLKRRPCQIMYEKKTMSNRRELSSLEIFWQILTCLTTCQNGTALYQTSMWFEFLRHLVTNQPPCWPKCSTSQCFAPCSPSFCMHSLFMRSILTRRKCTLAAHPDPKPLRQSRPPQDAIGSAPKKCTLSACTSNLIPMMSTFAKQA